MFIGHAAWRRGFDEHVGYLQGGGAARQVQLAGEGADSQAPQSAPRLQTQASSMGDMQVCSSELVQKFVLTGGPCGGKTTALARLREFFEERGFRAFIATIANLCGFKTF